MSGSKMNPRAILNRVVPAALSIGMEHQVMFSLSTMPKRNVILCSPDSMRWIPGAPGFWEIQLEPDKWEKLPVGAEIRDATKTLDPEDCDLVLMFGAQVVDTSGPKLHVPGGKQPMTATAGLPFGELARIPLIQYRKMVSETFGQSEELKVV